MPKKAFWIAIKTHIKPTNTQQYVHASSAHPPRTGWGIIKGELLRYLQTNSNKATFQMYKEKHVENMKERGYRQEIIDRSIRGIKLNKTHNADEPLTFTTTYSPHLLTYCLKRLLTKHWCLIEKSPLLSRLFPNRPTEAFRTHKSIRKQLTQARVIIPLLSPEVHYLPCGRTEAALQSPLPCMSCCWCPLVCF